MVVISGRFAVTVQKVSVVRTCFSSWYLHHIWLISQPSDDDWLRQVCHQATGHDCLKVVLHVPVLLCHQVRHVVLHQIMSAAVDFLARIGIFNKCGILQGDFFYWSHPLLGGTSSKELKIFTSCCLIGTLSLFGRDFAILNT